MGDASTHGDAECRDDKRGDMRCGDDRPSVPSTSAATSGAPADPAPSSALELGLSEAEFQHFRDTYFYGPAALLVDQVVRIDRRARTLEALARTDRPWPIASAQRGDPALHPPHVSGPELVLLTGNLGCLHAWCQHGIRWEAGWVGFGSRIHRADFRGLVRIGPPLELACAETRARVGPMRIVVRLAFTFRQGGRVVYEGDQSATFLLGDAARAALSGD